MIWEICSCRAKRVKGLGAQLVQMQMEHAKPSEKLQIVDNFLEKCGSEAASNNSSS
jgi:hypothetical protein